VLFVRRTGHWVLLAKNLDLDRRAGITHGGISKRMRWLKRGSNARIKNYPKTDKASRHE
jgi:hypothetical protein